MNEYFFSNEATDQLVETLAERLLNGAVVLLPTDTVYGLAVSPEHPDAVDRLYSIKQRPRHKRLPNMMHSRDALLEAGLTLNETAEKLLTSPLIPGSVTLVLPFGSGKKPSWVGTFEDLAIRIPNEAYLLDVLARTGPLYVTSANVHGLETPPTAAETLKQLEEKPDVVMHGPERASTPSTIVRCIGTPEVLREGIIPSSEIYSLLQQERHH